MALPINVEDFNNAFRTAVNYDDLMTLKKVLKE